VIGWRLRVAVLVWSIAALVALLWAAGWKPGLAWSTEAEPLDAALWNSPTSELQPAGRGRRLNGQAADGMQLVWLDRDGLEAGGRRFLWLCIDELGPEQRVAVAVGADGRLHWLPLHDTWANWRSVDLERLPSWRGEVQALAVAVLRVDYLPAQAAPARQPVLCGAELRGDEFASRLRSRWTQWFGGRGWSGRSINSAGLQLGESRAPDVLPVWAALSALALVLAVWVGGRRWLMPALAAVLLLPTAVELGQQTRRALAAQASAAAVDAAGSVLSAAPALVSEFDAMRPALRAAAVKRLLVLSSNSFLREYPVWLLREFNVAGAEPDWVADFSALQAEEAVLLVPRAEGWAWDATSGMLQREGLRLPARELASGPGWLALRLGAAGRSP
jgi:hypothetical protein